MKHVLRVFGLRFLSLGQEPDEWDFEDTDVNEITGGATHDFERDTEPLDPCGEEPWEDYEEDGFGFRRP